MQGISRRSSDSMRLQAFGARTACARKHPACGPAGVRRVLARGMREHRCKAIEVRQNDPSRAACGNTDAASGTRESGTGHW
eukprot:800094-Alexandrium_andersonii.AAC.1